MSWTWEQYRTSLYHVTRMARWRQADLLCDSGYDPERDEWLDAIGEEVACES